jgi:hypothetical protein
MITECIYIFFVILTRKNVHFLEEHRQTNLYNRKTLRFL